MNFKTKITQTINLKFLNIFIFNAKFCMREPCGYWYINFFVKSRAEFWLNSNDI